MRVSTAELVSAVANAGALRFLDRADAAHPRGVGCGGRADPFHDRQTLRGEPDDPADPEARSLRGVWPGHHRIGVKVVETAGRSPEPFVPPFEAAGVKVIHKCTTVKHAVKAQSVGCAAVEIDGFEAAGHPGEDDIPSLILVPRAVDELSIPVIACGGFSDGRGLVAALAMGAEGISMGTRFLATQEAPVHDNLKQKLVEASELDTLLIFRKFRNTARVFKNSVALEVAEIESRPDSEFEDVAELVAGARGAVVLEEGDMEHGIWSAGVSTGLIHDIPTVAELVSRIVAEAEEIINKRLVGLSR